LSSAAVSIFGDSHLSSINVDDVTEVQSIKSDSVKFQAMNESLLVDHIFLLVNSK